MHSCVARDAETTPPPSLSAAYPRTSLPCLLHNTVAKQLLNPSKTLNRSARRKKKTLERCETLRGGKRLCWPQSIVKTSPGYQLQLYFPVFSFHAGVTPTHLPTYPRRLVAFAGCCLMKTSATHSLLGRRGELITTSRERRERLCCVWSGRAKEREGEAVYCVECTVSCKYR